MCPTCLLPSLRDFMDFLPCLCVYIAADLGVDVTTESSGEFLTPCRYGPGSCLRTLVDFLSETHNSLVREANRAGRQEARSVHLVLRQLQRVSLGFELILRACAD